MRSVARRTDIVAFSYGAWLAGMMFIQFLLSGGFVSVALGFGFIAVPITLHLWLLGSRPGNDTRGVLYFSLFFATIFISLFANTERLTTEVIAQMLGLLGLVGVGYLIAQHQDKNLLEKIFVWFAIFLSIVLVIVLIDNDRLWARLMGRLHSNLWAAVCIAAIPGALALRNHWASAALTVFVLYMVAFEFNARGPLLYGIATIVAFAVLWAFHNPRKALTPRTQALLVAGLGIALTGLIVNWDFVATNILFIDSVTRGLGSGFTGRLVLWGELLDVALANPLTGVGFRMHDTFVLVPGLVSAHNAYVAMLVDLGVIGLGLYLIIISASLWRSIAVQRRWLIGAYLVGYVLLGLTEARAVNVGNPASILFILALASTLSIRNVARSPITASAKRRAASLKAAQA